MSAAELALTMFVALVVFGPSKLPMLAHHLTKFLQTCRHYQRLIGQFWQQQLNEHQLQDNQRKAQEADERYRARQDDT